MFSRQLKFHGNLTETSDAEHHDLTFQGNKYNYHVFNIGLNNSEEPMEGSLDVLQENEEVVTIKEPVIVKQKHFLCTKVETFEKESEETHIKLESIFELKVHLNEIIGGFRIVQKCL